MADVGGLIASAVSAPTGLWAIILNWLEGGIVNYGWVIIVFTLLVKVCLSPLDLLVRFTNKKATLVQQKVAPQVARINKKYQNDKATAQMQTNALYKKEGYNAVASCLVMIVNLAVTLVVFFTLFASLREMSAYRAINQYEAIQTSYMSTLSTQTQNKVIERLNGLDVVYVKGADEQITSEAVSGYETSFKLIFEGDEANPESVGIFDNYFAINGELTEEQQNYLNNHFIEYNAESGESTSFLDMLSALTTESSEAATIEANKTWNEVKENWLWVDNIWVADNYKSPLPTYSDLKKLASDSKNSEYVSYVNNIDKDLYSVITTSVHNRDDRWNGYFILAILAGVTAFLSQYITELMSKSKNKEVNKLVEQSNPAGGAMKFMKILLPVLMIIFVLTSSAAFSIYIVASQIISIGISALTSVIVNACYKKKQQEVYEALEKEALRSMRKHKK